MALRPRPILGILALWVYDFVVFIIRYLSHGTEFGKDSKPYYSQKASYLEFGI